MRAGAGNAEKSKAAAFDWVGIEQSLDARGNAVLSRLLNAKQCGEIATRYAEEEGYRARIVMGRHGFGRGEYKYFSYPLPSLLDQLRHTLYPHLAPIANRWSRQLGIEVQYPDELDPFLARCHRAGQTRPTPLILEYGPGDYNCLHQDLYGEHVFPLQVAILLSEPGKDFTGGEFVMTESAPNGQRANAPVRGKRQCGNAAWRQSRPERESSRCRPNFPRLTLRADTAMTTLDLFQSPTSDQRESIGPCAFVLHGFALPYVDDLIPALADIAACSPFRNMVTPGGFTMSVALTNCGPLGWTTDRHGYRYTALDPDSGKPWPAMPNVFAALAREAAAAAGFRDFHPDACLVNRYLPGSRLSLHQDRNERDLGAPIVSVSLGMSATFLFGGDARSDKTARVPLHHGDVAVWGGEDRLRYHGVMPLKDMPHPLLGSQRVNFTFRRAG